MSLSSNLVVGLPLVIATTSYLFTSIHTRRRDAREAQLERINLQLANLYGPIYILTESRRRTWEALYRAKFDRPGALVNPAGLGDARLAEWRKWLEEVFQPSNVAISDIILKNAHFLESSDVPRCLLDAVAYTDSYKMAIKGWQGDPSATGGSFFDFPDELRMWAASGFSELKREQEALLRRKSKAGSLGSRSRASKIVGQTEITRVERPLAGGAHEVSHDYVVQIVFCVDATGSMNHLMRDVRGLVSSLPARLVDVMASQGKTVGRLRVRLIAFRDVEHDGASAIESSSFFEIPSDLPELAGFADRLVAEGGGDEPASGLHAVALAIKSDWIDVIPSRGRCVIVVLADSPPKDLTDWGRFESQGALPSSFEELTDLWQGDVALLSRKERRLILFTPASGLWERIGSEWDDVIWFPSPAGSGLTGLQLDEILSAVASSV